MLKFGFVTAACLSRQRPKTIKKSFSLLVALREWIRLDQIIRDRNHLKLSVF